MSLPENKPTPLSRGQLFTFKKNARIWPIPMLTGFCVGVPLLVGYYFEALRAGMIASMGGMAILYYNPYIPITKRVVTMFMFAFSFIIAFAVGICFSFNPWVASLVFGIFSMALQWTTGFFKTGSPGAFFPIMIAAVASSAPFNLHTMPYRIGLLAMGVIFTCFMSLLLALAMYRKGFDNAAVNVNTDKPRYENFIVSAIWGLFMFGSMALSHLLPVDKPYWIPISCAAVMLGANFSHVTEKAVHRILGTFVGLILCYFIINYLHSPLGICFSIILLQWLIEIVVVKNYGLAVIFITPLTILLAEFGDPLFHEPERLVVMRFVDIVIGSLIGFAGGYLVYHERIKHKAAKQIRKTLVRIKRELSGRSQHSKKS